MKKVFNRPSIFGIAPAQFSCGWIILPCLVLFLLAFSITPANSMDPRPHCKVCRRFTDTSPARIDTTYRFGKRAVKYQLCSMFCYLEFIEDYSEHESLSTRTLKFNSIGTEMELSINVYRAWFLYGVEGDVQKTQEPYSIAFGTEREAEAALEEHGGELMQFEELVEIVKELTDEYEPEKPGPRHSPNRRPGR